MTLYPGWLRISLTFLVPVSFAVTIPAQSLIGRLKWTTALSTVVLAIALFTAARLFWRYAFRHDTDHGPFPIQKKQGIMQHRTRTTTDGESHATRPARPVCIVGNQTG